MGELQIADVKLLIVMERGGSEINNALPRWFSWLGKTPIKNERRRGK
jgi:hypothetical protein